MLLNPTRLIGPTVVVVGLSIGGGSVALGVGPIVFTQVPVDETLPPPLDWERLDPRRDLPADSRLVQFDPARPDMGVVCLAPGFESAGRPDVSFDGTRVLFVGRQTADEPFGIWEVPSEGGDPRRVTPVIGEVTKAIYLSTIYTLDADQPVFQIGFTGHSGQLEYGGLYTCRTDGTHVQQITYMPNLAADPFQLSDGRLLFSRMMPGSGIDLMTVHTDGTDVFVFAAAHERPAIRTMATETPDGWVVYVEAPNLPYAGGGGGPLVAVKRTRSLHTRRLIAGDAGGPYHSPTALSDGKLLVSHQPTTDETYGLYIVDPATGRRESRVYDDPKMHDLHARPIAPRKIPAGRSSVVDPTWDHGLLYCMNAYLTDREAGARLLPEGHISRVQVFTWGQKLLGEAPVRQDGSFALKVPAKTPLRLQTLDQRGNVLQAMESFIWVMPRESRGCIGCHEDRELTPPNRHVEALRKEPHVIGLDATKRREHATEQRYERKPSE